jgi:UDP-N-acetylglucosamine enolpyruvyl transferase
MVQDLCFFLERCGVKIEGIGTSTLIVHGVEGFDLPALNVELLSGSDRFRRPIFVR